MILIEQLDTTETLSVNKMLKAICVNWKCWKIRNY